MLPRYETPGRFVIQDVQNNKYLQHEGSGLDHPYEDVDSTDEATVWHTLQHVSYVLWWYVDMHRSYRVVNLDTGDHFIKDKKRGISRVIPEPYNPELLQPQGGNKE